MCDKEDGRKQNFKGINFFQCRMLMYFKHLIASSNQPEVHREAKKITRFSSKTLLIRMYTSMQPATPAVMLVIQNSNGMLKSNLCILESQTSLIPHSRMISCVAHNPTHTVCLSAMFIYVCDLDTYDPSILVPSVYTPLKR